MAASSQSDLSRQPPQLSIVRQDFPLNETSRTRNFKGGGGGGSVTDITMKDYVDARTAATEAQNDARFADVLSEIRTVRSELSSDVSALSAQLGAINERMSTLQQTMPSRWTIWGAAISTAIGLAALVYTIISYGGDRFDGGVQFTASTFKDSQEAKALSEENARQIERLGSDIKTLVETLKAAPNPSPPPAP